MSENIKQFNDLLARMNTEELYAARRLIDDTLGEVGTDMLTKQERDMLNIGHIIQTLISVRTRTGLGLKEAKALIDRARILKLWGL